MQAATKLGANRLITPHDRKVAANAKSIYTRDKKTLGLTNQVIGDKLKISQSAVSQYLSGNIAMGANIIISLADILHVDILTIDPKFNKRFRPNTTNPDTEGIIPVIGTASGRPPTQASATVPANVPRTTYAIQVDSDLYFPTIELNSIIGAEPLTKIKIGNTVLFRRLGEAHFEIMQVVKITGKAFHLTSLVSQYTAKKFGNKHFGTKYSMNGDVTLPLEQIITMHKIVVTMGPQ